MKCRVLHILILLTSIFVAVGCVVDNEEVGASKEGRYGTLHFGEEQIPVNLAEASDSGDFVVILLTPLTDKSNVTTSAMIGLKSELLGTKVDVERLYCNDDYIVIYEDPQCYYASFRPLQRGYIYINRGDKGVSLDLDVVLYDGTQLRYSQHNLPLKRI